MLSAWENTHLAWMLSLSLSLSLSSLSPRFISPLKKRERRNRERVPFLLVLRPISICPYPENMDAYLGGEIQSEASVSVAITPAAHGKKEEP